MNYKKCTVICELGANHQGNIDIAKEMIRQAKLAGAHYCKFQKRDVDNYPQEWNKPYNSENAFGNTYLEHRQNLEFSVAQHFELKSYCEEIGISYSCSVWDIQSAKDIISLHPDYIKIPSACNNNYNLIDYVYLNYNGYIHISVGMATKKEREELYDYLKDKKHRIIIYWTTSNYPSKFEDLFLLEIKKIKDKGFKIGYSAHNLGIAISPITYVLGCEYIEHHFTLDRTMKGTDQSASLEPQGVSKLCRDLKAVYKSLNYKGEDITAEEKKNRNKLRIN